MTTAKIKLQNPHPAQQKILKSKASRVVVNSGRQFGKTSLMLRIAIEHMLSATFKNKKLPSVLYVTPTTSLGVDVYKELLSYLPEEIIVEQNATRLFIKLQNGSTFRIISAESGGVAFRGKRFSLIINDEFAHYKDAKTLFTESIEPTVLSYGEEARIFFISTPNGQNYFFDLYNRGLKDEKDVNGKRKYETFHFTTYDNPHISKAYLDEKKAELPELVFGQEHLALFNSNASNPFGDHIKKNTIPTLVKGRSDCFGVDLAKSLDFSVILGLKTNKENTCAEMSYYSRWQGLDWTIVKERILALPRSVEVCIDSTGVGDPMMDFLKLERNKLVGYKISKATKGNLIRELIKAVEMGKVKYTEDVAKEMEVFEYAYNAKTGYLSYQAQEGYHDDQVIALALAWYIYNRRTRRTNTYNMRRA